MALGVEAEAAAVGGVAVDGVAAAVEERISNVRYRSVPDGF